jgi:hypothetical protein
VQRADATRIGALGGQLREQACRRLDALIEREAVDGARACRLAGGAAQGVVLDQVDDAGRRALRSRFRWRASR